MTIYPCDLTPSEAPLPNVLPLASSLDENFPLYSLAGVLAGAVLMLGYQRWKSSVHRIRLAAKADALMDEVNREGESLKAQILLEAKEQALEIKSRAEATLVDARQLQLGREQKLDRRSEQLDTQEASLRKQQRGLENSQQRLDTGLKSLAEKRDEIEQLENQQRRMLETLSGMTRAEASERLMSSLNEELEHERGRVILKQKKRITESAKEVAAAASVSSATGRSRVTSSLNDRALICAMLSPRKVTASESACSPVPWQAEQGALRTKRIDLSRIIWLLDVARTWCTCARALQNRP